jgi:type I restriction enzyme M protein
LTAAANLLKVGVIFEIGQGWMSSDIKNLSAFVWSIAETLRGDFKQSEYGKVILPFVVLRRLDCILEATKPAVLDMAVPLPL